MEAALTEAAELELGVVILTHGPKGEYGPLAEQLVEQGVSGSAVTLIQNPVDPSDPEPEPPGARTPGSCGCPTTWPTRAV